MPATEECNGFFLNCSFKTAAAAGSFVMIILFVSTCTVFLEQLLPFGSQQFISSLCHFWRYLTVMRKTLIISYNSFMSWSRLACMSSARRMSVSMALITSCWVILSEVLFSFYELNNSSSPLEYFVVKQFLRNNLSAYPVFDYQNRNKILQITELWRLTLITLNSKLLDQLNIIIFMYIFIIWRSDNI